MMNTIKHVFVVFLVTFSLQIKGETLDSIMKIHDDKVAKARKVYDAAIKKATDSTVKRLEQLKRAKTRAGNLEEAIAVKNQINKLQGNPPITTEDDGEIGGVPSDPDEAPVKFSESQATRALKKRYVDFHEALIESKFDKALEFLDPKMKAAVDKNVLKGHLQILSGVFKAFKIKKGGVDLERVKYTKKLKEARITGKLRSSLTGKWNESKDPSYWIYKRGEWYLGDDKELRKLF